MFSSKGAVVEKTRLLDEDDELSKPRCCLMLCIFPWKPDKIYHYLLGKSEENSKKNKQLQLVQNQDYKTKPYNNEQMREPRQDYEQFVVNSRTSRYDFMQDVEKDARDSESDENESIMKNGFPIFVSIDNKQFTWKKSTNFVDSFSHQGLWITKTRDRNPAVLLNHSNAWMKYVSLAANGFLLCVKARLRNNYFFLAAIDEDDSVGIYKKDRIESTPAQFRRFVWRYESRLVAGERKFVLLSSDGKFLSVHRSGTEKKTIKLTSQFELAASWIEED